MRSTIADTVLLNGHIYSADMSGKETIARAAAVKEGKIIFVGADGAAKEFIGENTQVIDLEGKMVLPGFADVHNHSQEMAMSMFALTMYSMTTRDQYLEAIEGWRRENPHCTYIKGNGWNLAAFIEKLPAKEDLDAICPDIPVALFDTSHHILWSNSMAMKNAGISKETPDPPGGALERDPETGEPTGIFYESAAYGMIMKNFPDFDVWQYKAGIRAYQAMANANGILLSQDCYLVAGKNPIQAYRELAQEGQLTMRIRGTYGIEPSTAGSQYKAPEEAAKDFDEFIRIASEAREKDQVSDLFQMNSIKIFEDGGGYTCVMNEPFEGTEDNCGTPVWPDDQLSLICEKAEAAGFQIHVHCMGDGATKKTLDAFQYAKDKGRTGKRNTITHFMLVDDKDLNRLAELEVVGASQPFWMCRDDFYSRLNFPVFGEKRTNEFYPMAKLVKKGVVMASASDWPITPANAPLQAIQIGVTRTIPYDNPYIPMVNLDKNPEYRFPLGPLDDPQKECVDLKTMIRATTVNGAYACFLEEITGTIEEGKSADFVILDKNLFEIKSSEIEKTNVLMTMFRGEVVYASNSVTVADHRIVTRKTAPLYPGDPTPRTLIVKSGITVRDLADALNPPMGGSFEIIKDGEKLSKSSSAPVSETMSVNAAAADGFVSGYSIKVEEPKKRNHFRVCEASAEGCTIMLDAAAPGITINDVYLLRDSNKVSATTTEVITKDGGKTYEIKADDWNSGKDLMKGEKYEIYLYSESHEFGETAEIIIP